jgi:hypothetical protein
MSEIDLLSKETLISALLWDTDRPAAFLVGSPLSIKDGIGVPDIAGVVQLIRSEFAGKAPEKANARFIEELAAKKGVEAYQIAMKRLFEIGGVSGVKDLIRRAVLAARKPGAPELAEGTDGNPDDWNIPPGPKGLAELVSRGGYRFTGPILTTNFDPLISLAIEKDGAQAIPIPLDKDGAISMKTVDAKYKQVVHLHGFWRQADSLHTQTQLTQPRPQLKASLKRFLDEHSLIVAAYGGWDDVFTTTFVEAMDDLDAKLDILWCFHETDAEDIEEKHAGLIKRIRPAIIAGRFRAFGGIDCHTIFSEILNEAVVARPRGDTASNIAGEVVRSAALDSPLAGWDLISTEYLNSLTPLEMPALVRYFDGAVPSWRHAVSDGIPRRAVAKLIADRLETLQSQADRCSIQLIRAAGGEGKTTLLLQAAADAAKTGGWCVLWRPLRDVRLYAEHVVKLDENKRWLIVVDDAERLIEDLEECAQLLLSNNRSNVHFLLAARDADWATARGDEPEWEGWLKAWVRPAQAILLRGIENSDAASVVEAWEKCGEAGLGDLTNLPTTAERVTALIENVRASVGYPTGITPSSDSDGSFFGGLLAVRFSPAELRAHVRTFLSRLKDDRIQGSSYNLFDALGYIAACHSIGIAGIDERVLAKLVNVTPAFVQSRVVKPLGEEAAAVSSGGYVFTRHRKVAEAIVVEIDLMSAADLGEIWAELVRKTALAGRSGPNGISFKGHPSFSGVVHAGPRLIRELPVQISEERRKAIAVKAAEAYVATEPNRLDALTDLGRTYRSARRWDEAISVFIENVDVTADQNRTFETDGERVEFEKNIRGYWTEWSNCARMRSQTVEDALAAVWLAGISLSDYLGASPITSEDIMFGCQSIAASFKDLVETDPKPDWINGMQASVYLGTCKDFSTSLRPEEPAGQIGISTATKPTCFKEAIEWLTSAVAMAGRSIKNGSFRVTNPDKLEFHSLKAFIFGLTGTAGEKVFINPLSKYLQRDAAMMQEAIARVLKDSSVGIYDQMPSEESFEIAKKRALSVIAGLSGDVKKRVRTHFEQEGWASLKDAGNDTSN